MSDEGPRLLARDQEQLREVAAALRTGRRTVVFLVCNAAMRPIALDYLRDRAEREIAEPIALMEPEQTLNALTELEKLPPEEVRSFLLVHTAPDVVRTLNWHREKLRRGASALVWLDGVDGLRALRQLGPDAYSFRDTLVVIQGEKPVVVAPAAEESVDVQLARLRYSGAETPVERGLAAVWLVNELMSRNAMSEARQIIEQALMELPPGIDESKSARFIRGYLYKFLADMASMLTQCHYWMKQALQEIEGIESPDVESLAIALEADSASLLGVDHRAALRALAMARKHWELFPGAGSRAHVLASAAGTWTDYGDMRAARALLKEALPYSDDDFWNRSTRLTQEADLDIESGRFERALATLHDAYEQRLHAKLDTFANASRIAQCHRLMSDYGAAKRILEDLVQHGNNVKYPIGLAIIMVYAGDAHGGISTLRSILHNALTEKNDAHLYTASDNLVTIIRQAHEAQRITNTEINDCLADLDVAEATACAIAGEDPPWYAILFPALRAHILALRPEGLDQAITLVSKSLERARSEFIDAVPKLVRQLVYHQLQASRIADAQKTLDAYLAEVIAERHLRELSRLRAYAVVALVRAGASQADIDREMQALRNVFDDMDAPRIAADALLEAAEMLPATSMHPDAYALADEASSLYAEMPYPFQEARALEVMGDVLSARGDATEALRCYRTSLGICDRFGMRLRWQLLESKIAQRI